MENWIAKGLWQLVVHHFYIGKYSAGLRWISKGISRNVGTGDMGCKLSEKPRKLNGNDRTVNLSAEYYQ